MISGASEPLYGKVAVVDDEERADFADPRPAGGPPTVATVEGMSLQWVAALCMVAEVATNQIVDIYMHIVCAIALVMMLLRVVPPCLEYLGMVSLGLAGVAVHVAGAVDASEFAIFQVALYTGMAYHGLHGIVRMTFGCCGGAATRPAVSREFFLVRTPRYMEGAAAKVEASMGPKASGLCGHFVRIYCSLNFCLVLLVLLAGAGLFFATEDLCAVETYDARLVLPSNALAAGRLPPLELATKEKMSGMEPLPMDFSGLWWIRWRENPYPLYAHAKLEEVVSLAGMYHKGDFGNTSNMDSDDFGINSSYYPVAASAPTGWTRRWGFSNSLVSRVGIMVAATKKAPTSPFNVDIESPTHIFIHGGGADRWTMDYLNDDEWVRNIETDGPRDWHYMFTRIVYHDGSPSPHFEEFVRHMGATKIRVFSTGSWPCRKCGALPFGSCSRCAVACSGDEL